MANKHMKRCPISLIFREMQMKTIMGYHFIPIRMTIIKTNKQTKPENISVGEAVERVEPLRITGGNVKWCSCCGEYYGGSSKKLNKELPYNPTIPLLGISVPKTVKSRGSNRYLLTHVHSSVIHHNQKMETTQMSIDG